MVPADTNATSQPVRHKAASTPEPTSLCQNPNNVLTIKLVTDHPKHYSGCNTLNPAGSTVLPAPKRWPRLQATAASIR
jgi:hypothetical protein